jgi:hypothetical protein
VVVPPRRQHRVPGGRPGSGRCTSETR